MRELFKKYLYRSCACMCTASGDNPITVTLLVVLAYAAFGWVEGQVEALITGGSFRHWVDPAISVVFIWYGAFAVYVCALRRGVKAVQEGDA